MKNNKISLRKLQFSYKHRSKLEEKVIKYNTASKGTQKKGIKSYIVGMRTAKKGFTLVELLVVIAIMGILSSMGFVGLQGAIENTKVKDAALNTSAFLERVANDANRRSESLCIQKSGDQKIEVRLFVDGKCSDSKVDEFSIESPLKFVSNGCNIGNQFDVKDDGAADDWLNSSTLTVFKPKLGLSAAPSSGYVTVQYGGETHCAAAFKSKTKNSIIPMVGDNEGWDEL